MNPRVPLMIAVVALAVVPFLARSAEPGGGAMREQKVKETVPPPARDAAQARAKIAESKTELKNAVAALGKARGDMTKALKKSDALNASARTHVAAALKQIQEPGAGNADKIESIRKQLESAMKDLEAQDKLGNFEIQDLMSRYNQAETLASSVQKKLDDAEKSVIGKI
jgi:chromosome segregation ATPase